MQPCIEAAHSSAVFTVPGNGICIHYYMEDALILLSMTSDEDAGVKW